MPRKIQRDKYKDDRAQAALNRLLERLLGRGKVEEAERRDG